MGDSSLESQVELTEEQTSYKNMPSAAVQVARWGALAFGVYYGNARLNELRETRPAEREVARAALAAQMAKEEAAKLQAQKEFEADSILYGSAKNLPSETLQTTLFIQKFFEWVKNIRKRSRIPEQFEGDVQGSHQSQPCTHSQQCSPLFTPRFSSKFHTHFLLFV